MGLNEEKKNEIWADQYSFYASFIVDVWLIDWIIDVWKFDISKFERKIVIRNKKSEWKMWTQWINKVSVFRLHIIFAVLKLVWN